MIAFSYGAESIGAATYNRAWLGREMRASDDEGGSVFRSPSNSSRFLVKPLTALKTLLYGWHCAAFAKAMG
ncbi:MAG: hypothetical protein M3R07_11740 [Gemmatimonadota bacterium]|nr:hypothetical protein [Gemmatimonadota bacterium]